MRDVVGRSAQEWIGERVGGVGDSILGGTGGGAWTPAHGNETTAADPWWKGLRFDQGGRLIPYHDSEWSARELAVSEPPFPEIARDYLVQFKDKAADVNNWACAAIYANPADAAKVQKALDEYQPKTELIADNLRLIGDHTK